MPPIFFSNVDQENSSGRDIAVLRGKRGAILLATIVFFVFLQTYSRTMDNGQGHTEHVLLKPKIVQNENK